MGASNKALTVGEKSGVRNLWWEKPKDLRLGTEDLKDQAEESEGLPIIQMAAIKERTRQTSQEEWTPLFSIHHALLKNVTSPIDLNPLLHDKMTAPVFLPAHFILIGAKWLLFSITHNLKVLTRDAQIN